MKYVLVTIALLISSMSAYFSVMGMLTIFPMQPEAIIGMAILLELAKISSAYWLHLHWQQLGKYLKYYLVTAAVALALITSLGVFSFLQNAHSSKVVQIENGAKKQVANIDIDIQSKQNEIDDIQTRIGLITNSITKSTELSKRKNDVDVVGSNSEAKLKELQKERQNKTAEINILEKQKLDYGATAKSEASEIGGLRYIADLLGVGGEHTSTIFCVVLSMFIDPLAISLLLASNVIPVAPLLNKPVRQSESSPVKRKYKVRRIAVHKPKTKPVQAKLKVKPKKNELKRIYIPRGATIVTRGRPPKNGYNIPKGALRN